MAEVIRIEELATPFHRGELAIQDRLGVRERVHSYAPRFIRDHMPDEHREFFAALPQVIVGSVDDQGRPWASMLVGRPGFAASDDPTEFAFGANPLYGDPLGDNLKPGAALGFLGIEFHTRRRNRMNGKVTAVSDQGFKVGVDQSFGNCPQYIQARGFAVTEAVDAPDTERPVHRNDRIGAPEREIIDKADTFFIASMYLEDASDGGQDNSHDDRSQGVDVSHRGGRPGFVRVASRSSDNGQDRRQSQDQDKSELLFPDFAGNLHFNTLGNISLCPRVGLLFPDFETGNLLYVTGSAEIIWEGEELEAFEGAERLVRIKVEETICVENSLPLRWQFLDYAQDLTRTGSWQDTDDAIAAKRDCNTWRNFSVARIEKESETISSFYLVPEDGKAIAGYTAGQYLPIRLEIPGHDGLASRTYTLSAAPTGRFYRLSIKREDKGLVSRYFHDRIRPGSIIEALAPRGKFTLAEDSERPVVLISGGVGITPMIAMLDQLLFSGGKSGNFRNVSFIHGTQDGSQHAFAKHLATIKEHYEQVSAHVSYASPRENDVEGVNFDNRGYVDRQVLQSLLPLDDYDYYLCGPPPFMQALYDSLTGLGVSEARIAYESFGPATILKSAASEGAGVTGAPTTIAKSGREPVRVHFAKSGIEAEWTPEAGTLLEFAEAQGLAPPNSCHRGICGSCKTKVKCGDVDYLDDPVADIGTGEALICCSVPNSPSGEGTCGEGFGLVLDL